MLVELAVGDAYGFGFEYADENLPKNKLLGYVMHPVFRQHPGQYTDDTQMSLAIAEHLLSGEVTNKENLARRFVQGFKRDQRDGYARGFQAILESIKDEHEFLARVIPDSDKSGGAMRAGPIGYLSSPELVKDVASFQAALTHDTPDGRAAAEATALMTHYFIYDRGPKALLGMWLEGKVPPRKWNEPWEGRIKAQGWMDVRAAVTAIQEENSLADVLRRVVSFGGDTDTAAAIAMAAASQSRELSKNLPLILYQNLENGPYGRDYLQSVSDQLRNKYARSI